MAVIDHHQSFVYKRAKEYLEAMKGTEMGKILNEFIQYKDNHIEDQSKRIKEMRSVFDGIRRFTK